MERREIVALQNLLKANDLIAEQINRRLTEEGVLLVDLISSPGAGKTTLIERTKDLLPDLKFAVINGDVQTDRDARRLKEKGIPAVQIATGGECHLEAHMVEQVLDDVLSERPDIIFIENVGNLICPSEFKLGEHLRVVLLSAPEGDDKPQKYPLAFLTSQVFLITKVDLVQHLPFDPERAKEDALSVNPKLRVIKVSALTGEGLDEWASLLKEELSRVRENFSDKDER